MYTPTTAWDREPTDYELNVFYGKDKSTNYRDEMVETLTETVRSTPVKKLGLQYVRYESSGSASTAMYPLVEVITDYGTDREALEALVSVIEKSDCPLVAAYRLAIAERFADAHADELEEFTK